MLARCMVLGSCGACGTLGFPGQQAAHETHVGHVCTLSPTLSTWGLHWGCGEVVSSVVGAQTMLKD